MPALVMMNMKPVLPGLSMSIWRRKALRFNSIAPARINSTLPSASNSGAVTSTTGAPVNLLASGAETTPALRATVSSNH